MMTSPDHMNAVEWFDLLRIDFPTTDFPLLRSEPDWVVAANYLRDSAIFSRFAPDPRYYADWRAWAYVLFNNMGGG